MSYYFINQGIQRVFQAALGLAGSGAHQAPGSFQLPAVLFPLCLDSQVFTLIVVEVSAAPGITFPCNNAQRQKEKGNVCFCLLLLYKTKETFSRSPCRFSHVTLVKISSHAPS